MINQLLKSEWERIFARKKTNVLFAVFFIIVLLNSIWLDFFEVGFYSREHSVTLNSLNFPVFLANSSFSLLVVVFLPILFLDSLSQEIQSGPYCLAVLRPVSKLALLWSKWFTLTLLMLFYLLLMLLVGIFYGYLFMPQESMVLFLEGEIQYDLIQSLVYTVQYYAILFVVLLNILVIVTLTSLLVSNTILCYFITVLFVIGSGVVFKDFRFFFFAGEEAFRLLAYGNPAFYTIVGLILLTGTSLCMYIWNKKDWF